MSPEEAMLLPWFISLMIGFPIAGFFIARRDMRSKNKPLVGRHARPSQINGTAPVHENA